MTINVEKLNKYIEEDKIMVFENDAEAMEFYNTSDFQNFQTVEEMDTYCGKYDFHIGERRYHIHYDDALDIYAAETEKTDRQFTVSELSTLSDGMIALIESGNTALKCIYDLTVSDVLNITLKRYAKLNTKICRMMEN